MLEQKETPGLGDFITGADFRERFAGKTATRALRVTKGEGEAEDEIRAISGATISSESVSAIANATVRNLREAIRRAPPGGG